MIPYKLHLLQLLNDTDKSASKDFCTHMQVVLGENRFDDVIAFGDEATFHITGKVNKHTNAYGELNILMQYWSTCEILLRLTCLRHIEVFVFVLFFERTTVNSEAYFAMLQNWLMELLFEGEQADFIFE